jgi:circadian clock protein KaiC
MRGQAHLAGLHTFRISEQGLHVFPRFPEIAVPSPVEVSTKRESIGIAGLDEMMGGGIPEGEAILVAGPSGTGKTIATLQFLVEGVRQGEPGVMVTFEESPEEHIRKALSFGWDLRKMVADNLLELIYLRPVDLTVEEVLEWLEQAVARTGAKRVVINSVSGFELAIAPSEREDFREALYRFSRGFLGRHITLMMTSETPGIFAEPYPSFYRISFLTDNIVLFRFVEIESRLALALAVVKMRTSAHSRDLREYAITERGIEVGAPFVDYSGVLTGIPTPVLPTETLVRRLSDEERTVLRVLMERGEQTATQVAQHGNLDERLVERLLAGLSRRSLVAQVVEPDRVTFHAILPEPRGQRNSAW